ncbi:PilT/PilU family type 4a pilus ATPase [Exilibacterium tricleocarpae]|uniref:PilT/PilU family type 4a pilus ATPase n=2 Tax=Exilibacterium tricleocarpae TaxID=2591008 RepID=A0A545TKA6_9GAMM|nr:PilT/PilU family type 4a pilus ATPase [Exilibacterium tricleocarpae]
MVARSASDLYINVGAPPTIKVEGSHHRMGSENLSAERVQALIDGVLSERQRRDFERDMEMDLGMEFPKVGRFRLNVYRQKGLPAMVVRYIKDTIPSISELGLPEVLHDLAMQEHGLLLVVGATGSGKSTTLAALIDHRNQNRTGHILTVEDPIEFTHRHKRSLVSQREVGIDTRSYADALKYGLREAPDVIMIGEIRDADTAMQALRYAETGHLCISTMHATNANQALDRFMNFFPAAAQRRVQQDLAHHLVAILSQRLAVGVDDKRVAVVEIMMRTPHIAELIDKGETDKIKEAMGGGANGECQTFDDALYKLIAERRISKAEGLRLADSRINLNLRLRLDGKRQPDNAGTRTRHWFSKTADFSRYKKVNVRARKTSLERRPEMEKMLTAAIKQAAVDRGYHIDEKAPDIVLHYAFGLRQDGLRQDHLPQNHSPQNHSPQNHSPQNKGLDIDGGQAEPVPGADSALAKGGLAIQAKEVRSGEVVWTLIAPRPLGEQLKGQQELNTEISNLLGSLPVAGKAKL